jgi:hypothetical protein
MTPTIAGALALVLPLLLIALLFLRRNIFVLLFFVALSAVGIGYLSTTGALDDIGSQVLTQVEHYTADKAAEPVPAAAPATP